MLFAQVILSFPRSSVGMPARALQRRVTDRWSGQDGFPRWSVGTRKPEKKIDRRYRGGSEGRESEVSGTVSRVQMGDTQHTRKPKVVVTEVGREDVAERRAREASIVEPGTAAHHARERPGRLCVGRFVHRHSGTIPRHCRSGPRRLARNCPVDKCPRRWFVCK